MLFNNVNVSDFIFEIKPSRFLFANIDKVDARLIAYLGAVAKPEPHPSFSKKLNHIEELLERKQQLHAMKLEEITRQHKMPTAVASLHRSFVELLKKEIGCIEQTLADEIAESREWQYVYEILSPSH